MYNWQFYSWPYFTYSLKSLQAISVAFAKELVIPKGLMISLNEDAKQETWVEIFILEAFKTSEIEGKYMSREDVMSSIKKKPGA